MGSKCVEIARDRAKDRAIITKVARDLTQKCREYRDSADARAQGFYPYFRRIDDTVGNHVVCDGQTKIMIGSNNYLGLAQDERVIEAACDAARKFGSGCTGSRLLNGNIRLHEELEDALADFLQREAVLLFSTGFFANQGAIATLTEDEDAILCDRENHASIIDGCQFAPAKLVPFRHNSAVSLRNRLKRLPEECGKLVVLDGVFSMSGDIADLPPILEVAKEFGAFTYVDEAHALGVLGPEGRGTVHHFGVNDDVVDVVARARALAEDVAAAAPFAPFAPDDLAQVPLTFHSPHLRSLFPIG